METTVKKNELKSFSYSFGTTKTAEEVFNFLLEVTNWWTGIHEETIKGKSAEINDEFSFSAGGGVHFSKQRLIKLVPYSKIVWRVTESDLTFLKAPDEWVNTKLCFDITTEGKKTTITFIHSGLTPLFECYNGCSTAWTAYMKNLEQSLITG